MKDEKLLILSKDLIAKNIELGTFEKGIISARMSVIRAKQSLQNAEDKLNDLKSKELQTTQAIEVIKDSMREVLRLPTIANANISTESDYDSRSEDISTPVEITDEDLEKAIQKEDNPMPGVQIIRTPNYEPPSEKEILALLEAVGQSAVKKPWVGAVWKGDDIPF